MLSVISGRSPPITRPTAANPIIRDKRNDLLLRQVKEPRVETSLAMITVPNTISRDKLTWSLRVTMRRELKIRSFDTVLNLV